MIFMFYKIIHFICLNNMKERNYDFVFQLSDTILWKDLTPKSEIMEFLIYKEIFLCNSHAPLFDIDT